MPTLPPPPPSLSLSPLRILSQKPSDGKRTRMIYVAAKMAELRERYAVETKKHFSCHRIVKAIPCLDGWSILKGDNKTIVEGSAYM